MQIDGHEENINFMIPATLVIIIYVNLRKINLVGSGK